MHGVLSFFDKKQKLAIRCLPPRLLVVLPTKPWKTSDICRAYYSFIFCTAYSGWLSFLRLIILITITR